MKNEETLLEYSDRERKTDPWWEDVYQILADNDRRLRAAPVIASPAVPQVRCSTAVVEDNHERPCTVCGLPFVAKRRDARFCSAKCRQAASRRAAA